jgi:predicted cupin superfamily sugar epimerase
MHSGARELVERLGLVPHPEGGFYRETFRSSVEISVDGRARAASTAIYFLLPAGERSVLHRIDADEVWHHYDGDPLELFTLSESRAAERVRLGRCVSRGERPQHVVHAGDYQGARVAGDSYALVGCTVAPGFEFSAFVLPSRAELLAKFPEHANIIYELTSVRVGAP